MSQASKRSRSVVGRRQTVTYSTTAQPTYTVQELTPADFLNPHPGDEFFYGDAHAALVAYLAACFRFLYRYNPFVAVLVGTKIVWDDPALAQPAPDLAIVANLADPARPRDRLDVAAEGVRPRFILEVTSPVLADIDLVDKVGVYGRAGVQEYFIVQPATQTGPALSVLAYRLNQGVYQPVAPDAEGRLYSATNRVWVTVQPPHVGELQEGDTTQGLRLVEERTGRALTPPDHAEEESRTGIQVDAALRAQSIASKLNLGR